MTTTAASAISYFDLAQQQQDESLTHEPKPQQPTRIDVAKFTERFKNFFRGPSAGKERRASRPNTRHQKTQTRA
ncbi:hypothetical protein THAOC_20311, partial [Thalassiosira oceanica]